MALDKQGNLYITDSYNHRVRKVTPDGKINTVAGFGATGYTASGLSGDGGPATGAKMYMPWSVFVMPDGSLGIMEYGNRVVRVVNQDGIINTVAGMGTTYTDGSLAYNAYLFNTGQWTTSPNGEIYMFVQGRQIARITNALPGFNALDYAIPSEDGSTLWRFDRRGKHLQTNNALTGAVITTFGYDATGKLITITDGDANVTTIQRDGAGNATGIVSPYGVRTALTLNTNGYLASVTDPGGNSTRFTYSSDGLMASMTDPNGGVYTFTHDAMGKLTKDQNPVGGGWTLTSSKTKTTQTSSITSAEGHTDTTLRERLATGGERMTQTSPSGAVTVTETSLDGSTTVTSSDGTVIKTKSSPDSRYGMNAPVFSSATITTPGGLTSTTTKTRTVTQSNPSDPLTVTSIADAATANGKTSRLSFNKATMTLTATTPMGKQTSATIDQQGRVIQSTVSGILPVSYTYDTKGRMSAVTQGTRSISYSFDVSGRISSMTDPIGNVFSFGYDGASRAISQTYPDGRVIAFTRDSNSNITSVTPPSKPAHNISFNTVNNGVLYSPPAVTGSGANNTAYAYNLDKQPTVITRPDGQTINYGYDTFGRISTVTALGATYNYTFGSGANCCGNPSLLSSILRTASGGSTQRLDYTYDGTFMLSEAWVGDLNATVRNAYNNDFQRISQSINGSNTVAYSYDNDGLLTNAGSLAITRNASNGFIAGTTLGSATTSQTYSTFGEISGYTAKYGAASIFDTQFTRDLLGRITRKIEAVGGVSTTYDYTYDMAGRLASVAKNGVVTASYVYDANGNRITATVSGATTQAYYDLQDRMTGYGSATYTYTANGDIASKTSNGLTTSYAYDALGNMTSATMPDGTIVEYVIDGLNRRVGKKVNGVLVQGFVYDGATAPIAELDGAGNVVATFIYGIKSHSPDYMIKGGVTYRIIADHRGSPRLVVDTATGNVTQKVEYDEWGNITSDTNPGFQPFGFAGGIYDNHTKLVKFGARDYDAETGRWTTKDAIRFAGRDTNLYSYSLNNPVNNIDPDGTKCVRWEFYSGDQKPGTGRLCLYDVCAHQWIQCWISRSGTYSPDEKKKKSIPPLPRGDYDIGGYSPVGPEHNKYESFCSGPNCWKVEIKHTQSTENGPGQVCSGGACELLRVHPDGGDPGTGGCIGIEQDSASAGIALINSGATTLTVR